MPNFIPVFDLIFETSTIFVRRPRLILVYVVCSPIRQRSLPSCTLREERATNSMLRACFSPRRVENLFKFVLVSMSAKIRQGTLAENPQRCPDVAGATRSCCRFCGTQIWWLRRDDYTYVIIAVWNAVALLRESWVDLRFNPLINCHIGRKNKVLLKKDFVRWIEIKRVR